MKPGTLFWLFFFLLSGTVASAQIRNDADSTSDDVTTPLSPAPPEKPAVDWDQVKQRMVYGGNLGLTFYGGYTFFQLSPQAGYKIKNNLIGGAGLQLLSISSRQQSYWQYGPDVFLRAHFFNVLFTQAQFEYLNFEDYLLPGKRVWNPAMLLGFGYGTYGYSFGLYTNVINNRFNEVIYPGNIYLGGRAFFFRGQIFF